QQIVGPERDPADAEVELDLVVADRLGDLLEAAFTELIGSDTGLLGVHDPVRGDREDELRDDELPLRFKGGDEDVEAGGELVVGDGERRDEAQDVLARAAHQHDEAVVEAPGLHRFGAVLVAQLDADHQPDAPDVDRAGNAAQTLQAEAAEAPGPLVAALLVEDVEGGQGSGAGYGIAAEGRAVGPGRPAVHDRPGGDDPAQREAGGDALGEEDDVGGDAEGLGGEGPARPADAGLHLVEDQQ